MHASSLEMDLRDPELLRLRTVLLIHRGQAADPSNSISCRCTATPANLCALSNAIAVVVNRRLMALGPLA
jgi:hypothetical protein